MKIKKFRASSSTEAMDLVRREMGDHAVILAARMVDDPTAVARGERVEMTAAVDWEREEYELNQARAGKKSVAEPRPAGASLDLTAIEQRLEELRKLVLQTSTNGPSPDDIALDEISRVVYATMVGNDVEPALALRVVRSARQRLEHLSNRSQVAGAVQSTLKSLLPEPDASRRRVQALIGPTGVGKTTTAAKLAARAILEKQGPVVLVTCDTYRVAAVDQLRAYARAMGAGFEVAHDVPELSVILDRARRTKVILDTEGRGQRELKTLEPLYRFLRSRDDVDRHLVVSATTKPKDLGETVDRFRAAASPHRLLFTKIDETNSYGTFLSESVRSGLPVSYLGTGQKVPEEILVATKDKLAELAVSALG